MKDFVLIRGHFGVFAGYLESEDEHGNGWEIQTAGKILKNLVGN